MVDNLRSGLAKNALITISEACPKLKGEFEGFLDILFTKIMKKSIDNNSFINE